MPGALLWGYDLTNKKWIPLAVDANGYVKVDMTNINLDDLGDVSAPSPSDGEALVWDDATSKWIPGAGVAFACGDLASCALNDIGDVYVPSPTDEYLLYWDAPNSRWACRALVDADIPAAIARDAEVDADIATHTALTTGVHGVGAGIITSKTLTASAIAAALRSTTSTSYVDLADTTVTLTIVVTCDLLAPFAASISNNTAGAKVIMYSTVDTQVYLFFTAQGSLVTGNEATAGFAGHAAAVAAGDLSYLLRWKVSAGTGYTHYTRNTLEAIPT